MVYLSAEDFRSKALLLSLHDVQLQIAVFYRFLELLFIAIIMLFGHSMRVNGLFLLLVYHSGSQVFTFPILFMF